MLYDEYQSTLPALDTALKKREYHAALTQMSHLRPAVDRFFKEVMVNAEDAALKSNRIALLSSLQNSLSQIADITVLY